MERLKVRYESSVIDHIFRCDMQLPSLPIILGRSPDSRHVVDFMVVWCGVVRGARCRCRGVLMFGDHCHD